MKQGQSCDVLVIGAGPAGALAAALLAQGGERVWVLERDTFPRFSIGESLLPQSMQYLQEAGMLQPVVEAGFQYKNGARFVWGDQDTTFDFRDKFTPGWGTTYQVERARFDQVLIDCAQAAGAHVLYKHTVTQVIPDPIAPQVVASDGDGVPFKLSTRFVLDASGFGRTLQRLLNLARPSGFPPRAALFTHVTSHIAPGALDLSKITVGVHPNQHNLWYWLIPLSNTRASVGVVGHVDDILPPSGDTLLRLRQLVGEEPNLSHCLRHAEWDSPGRQMVGYASNVTSLVGQGYALLGNAGEFLDPVFSSGLTVALRSASTAVACLKRQLRGTSVDWQSEFETPLRQGITTFRAFVEAWYAGDLQKIFFASHQPPEIKRMLAAILAGYAWDSNNPYTVETSRRLGVLAQLCHK